MGAILVIKGARYLFAFRIYDITRYLAVAVVAEPFAFLFVVGAGDAFAAVVLRQETLN